MTIGQALAAASGKLKAASLPTPALDAEVLLAHLLNVDRSHLIAHAEEPLAASLDRRFDSLTRKRRDGMPVAYLIGHKEFYGLDFLVNQHVLIPRPETEQLVEEALRLYGSRALMPKTIADIGTGSGCIAVTLKKQLPGVTVYATDISKRALSVARKNARRHGVTIRFRHGDLLLPLKNLYLNLIVANLPYLDPQWMKHPGLRFEPPRALGAGIDGVALNQRILKQLNHYQPKAAVIMEIDPRQTKAMVKMVHEYLPGFKSAVHKDLDGFERMLVLTPHS